VYLGQGRLGLRKPEGHVHRLVHLHGRCEFGTSPRALTDLGIQGAEATVAVGLQRAHAEFLSQSQGLLVVGFGLRNIGRIGMGMDDAMEAVDPDTEGTVQLFNPRTQQWSAHFALDHDTGAVRGLPPSGRATVVALVLNTAHALATRQFLIRRERNPTPRDATG
jgi:hypothetical protein